MKITNEPPHSLRNSLLSSYTNEPIAAYSNETISDMNFFEKLKCDKNVNDRRSTVILFSKQYFPDLIKYILSDFKRSGEN